MDYIVEFFFQQMIGNPVRQAVDFVMTSIASLLDNFLRLDITNFPSMIAGIDFFTVSIQVIGVALTLLLCTVTILRYIYVPDAREVENPFFTILKTMLALFAIININSIIKILTEDLWDPLYQSMFSVDISEASSPINDGFADAMLNGLSSSMISFLMGIIVALLNIIILWNMVKFFIQVFERYVTLAVLLYTMPLAISQVVSPSLSNVFKSYFRVLNGQFVLMILHVFVGKLFLYNYFANAVEAWTSNNTFVFIFINLAILKLGQNIEGVLSSCGINVPSPGAGLLGTAAQSLMQMGMMLSGGRMLGAGAGKAAAAAAGRGGLFSTLKNQGMGAAFKASPGNMGQNAAKNAMARSTANSQAQAAKAKANAGVSSAHRGKMNFSGNNNPAHGAGSPLGTKTPPVTGAKYGAADSVPKTGQAAGAVQGANAGARANPTQGMRVTGAKATAAHTAQKNVAPNIGQAASAFGSGIANGFATGAIKGAAFGPAGIVAGGVAGAASAAYQTGKTFSAGGSFAASAASKMVDRPYSTSAKGISPARANLSNDELQAHFGYNENLGKYRVNDATAGGYSRSMAANGVTEATRINAQFTQQNNDGTFAVSDGVMFRADAMDLPSEALGRDNFVATDSLGNEWVVCPDMPHDVMDKMQGTWAQQDTEAAHWSSIIDRTSTPEGQANLAERIELLERARQGDFGYSENSPLYDNVKANLEKAQEAAPGQNIGQVTTDREKAVLSGAITRETFDYWVKTGGEGGWMYGDATPPPSKNKNSR